MADIRELRDLGAPELVERLDQNKEELFNLRFQLATGQLDNPMRIKQVRHEIAQILTIVRERELDSELAAKVSSVSERGDA
jgi:large subunit ribosomal protein L29